MPASPFSAFARLGGFLNHVLLKHYVLYASFYRVLIGTLLDFSLHF
jgi:hypothetical protein